MKKYLKYLFLPIIFVGFSSTSLAETGTGMPLKYISSCELDLNNDGNPDIALLIETIRGRELIVLLRTTHGYNAYIVSKGRPGMYLTCHFGKYVKETAAGEGKGKIYETNGTFIKLTLPEGSSVVYFWDGRTFKEVWTSD